MTAIVHGQIHVRLGPGTLEKIISEDPFLQFQRLISNRSENLVMEEMGTIKDLPRP